MSDAKPTIRVHTRPIRDVLAPISEQVAQLIIIDETARSNGSGIPDLTSAAESIGVAIQNLVQVGEDSVKAGDEILKSRMPIACEQIEAAGKLFLDAANELKEDKFSEDARALLITATRGLLTGTTNVLMTYDTFEVRRIVVLGESMIELLATAKSISQLEELVVLIKSVSQTLVQFVQLVEARQMELINESIRQKIIRENEALRKSSPLLVTALRTYINHPENDQARTSRDYAIEQALSSVHEIILAVSDLGMEEAAVKPTDTYLHHLEALDHLVYHNNKGEDAVAHYKPVVDMSAKVGRESKDHYQNAVTKAAQNLNAAFEAFRSGPPNQANADKTLRSIRDLNEAVQTAVADQVAVCSLNHDEPASSRFVEAVSTGTAVPEAEVTFRSDIKHLVSTALNVADTTGDVRRAQLLRNTCNRVNAYTDQVITSVDLLGKEPEDESVKQHLALLKDNLDYHAETLKTLMGTMVNPARMIAVSGVAAEDDIAAARDAAEKGDVAETKAAGQRVQRDVDVITSVAFVEAENSVDPSYSKPVLAASEKLKQVTTKLGNALDDYAQSPEDSSKKDEANLAAREVKVHILQLEKAVYGTFDSRADSKDFDEEVAAKEPSMKAALILLEDMEIGKKEAGDSGSPHQKESTSATEDKSPVESETSFEEEVLAGPPPEGPVADAARLLHAEANKWSEQGNPIIQKARTMARKMTLLAALSRYEVADGNRGQMINVAKQIAERAKMIRKLALEAAQTCSDKRLRADILYLCDQLPTMATQLKIIASVKAAMTSYSEDADQMLVVNAQNLMRTVVSIVRACEAASIRSFAANATVALAAVRWKRRTRASSGGE